MKPRLLVAYAQITGVGPLSVHCFRFHVRTCNTFAILHGFVLFKRLSSTFFFAMIFAENWNHFRLV